MSSGPPPPQHPTPPPPPPPPRPRPHRTPGCTVFGIAHGFCCAGTPQHPWLPGSLAPSLPASRRPCSCPPVHGGPALAPPLRTSPSCRAYPHLLCPPPNELNGAAMRVCPGAEGLEWRSTCHLGGTFVVVVAYTYKPPRQFFFLISEQRNRSQLEFVTQIAISNNRLSSIQARW
jgi:hypothetical protein